MKRCWLVILLWSLLIGSVYAQGAGLIVVRDSLGNDLTRFNLVPDSIEAADANAAIFNANMRNLTTAKYTLAIPGGRYYIGKDTTTYPHDIIDGCCIKIPPSRSVMIMGKGGQKFGDFLGPGGPDGLYDRIDASTVHLIYAGPHVDLEETTESITDDVVTFSGGYSPIAQDLKAHVMIDDLIYVITSVTPGESWTLDRAVPDADDKTDAVGYMTYTLIRDRGVGTRISGIGFRAHGGDPDHARDHCINCLLVENNTFGFNNSSIAVEDCAFWDFLVSCAMGTDLRQAFEEAESYTGDLLGDDHGDHSEWNHLFIAPAEGGAGIYFRSGQCVHHTIRELRFYPPVSSETMLRSAAVYFERGGFLAWTMAGISGQKATALRLGQNGPNVGDFYLNNIHFDGASWDQRFVDTDDDVIGPNRITAVNCSIVDGAHGEIESGVPLWNVPGGTHLLLQNCSPLPPASVRLPTVSTDYKCMAKIELCTLGTSGSGSGALAGGASTPNAILHSDTGADARTWFLGNTSNSGATEYYCGRWVGGPSGSGWDPQIWPVPAP